MKKILLLSIILLLTAFFYAGCAPAPVEPVKTAAATSAASKPAWEQEWEKTLAEASKEGAVSIYSSWAAETRTALAQAFKAKYGINAEFTSFGRGSDMLARTQAEKRAGLFAADAFGGGGGTLLTTMKPEGLLGPLEPLLILPEVTESKYWRSNKVPFLDKDKRAVGMLGGIQRYIIYNTDLIKKGEITSYKDMLKPQYKGKITLNDPTVTGSGAALISLLVQHVWNMEETKEWLAQLVRQQNVDIQRDQRLHIESVVRGKFAIGLAPHPDAMVEFFRAQAPVDAVFTKEGTYVTTAAGGIAIPTQLAHPNAARVFMNWLFSREGQAVFAPAFGNNSMRNDVAVEGLLPIFLPQPGETYFVDDEEDIILRGKLPAIAREAIAAAMK